MSPKSNYSTGCTVKECHSGGGVGLCVCVCVCVCWEEKEEGRMKGEEVKMKAVEGGHLIGQMWRTSCV